MLKAIPKPSTFRLTPYVSGMETTIVSWYDKKENAEFFRRCPPICDWLSTQGIQATFGALWVIFEEATPIGLAGIFNKDPFSRSCEIGLLVDKDSTTNKTAAVAAVTNLLGDYIFNYLNYHKVYIKLMPWREKLGKKIEAFGFSKECDLRDSCFFRGEYHSEMLYSCLKLEFKETI